MSCIFFGGRSAADTFPPGRAFRPSDQLTRAMTKCGQCGRSGHNRRLCPSKKRKAPSGGGAGNDGRPARGAKSAKRPRGGGMHDPIQAALAAVAQAAAENDAACQRLQLAHVQAETQRAQARAQASTKCTAAVAPAEAAPCPC